MELNQELLDLVVVSWIYNQVLFLLIQLLLGVTMNWMIENLHRQYVWCLCFLSFPFPSSSRLWGKLRYAWSGVNGVVYLPNSHRCGPEWYSGGAVGEDAAFQTRGWDLQADGPGWINVRLKQKGHHGEHTANKWKVLVDHLCLMWMFTIKSWVWRWNRPLMVPYWMERNEYELWADG